MSKPIRPRRWIALCAAYVVALQALLLPLSVAAGGPLAGSLCVTASAGNGQTPASHDTGCACAAGCGMACAACAVLAPPQASLALAGVFVRVEAPLLPAAPSARLAVRTPQNPRAPPVA